MWDWIAVHGARMALKEYPCDACELIDASGLGKNDFEPEDWAVIAEAIRLGSKILKHEKYVYTAGIYDGEWDTFRARPDIDAICVEYKIYED